MSSFDLGSDVNHYSMGNHGAAGGIAERRSSSCSSLFWYQIEQHIPRYKASTNWCRDRLIGLKDCTTGWLKLQSIEQSRAMDYSRLWFYKTESVWSIDQTSTRKISAVYNLRFCLTITTFCDKLDGVDTIPLIIEQSWLSNGSALIKVGQENAALTLIISVPMTIIRGPGGHFLTVYGLNIQIRWLCFSLVHED